MQNAYCFNRANLFIGLAIIITLLVVTIIFLWKDTNNKQIVQPIIIKETKTIRERQEQQEQLIDPIQRDNIAIKNYDYRKAYDPLEQPARRVARYELPPVDFKRIIDLPSRGYPDNFTQIGVVVRNDKKDHTHDKKNNDKHNDKNKIVNDDNRVLRLFGRQEYPGSNRYEYYVMINSGNDQIKIPINDNRKRRDELYDNDIIYIKELNDQYKVTLHPYDQPKYYPDILY
jgi:hypothetical protein